jgi:hypothetical protein
MNWEEYNSIYNNIYTDVNSWSPEVNKAKTFSFRV